MGKIGGVKGNKHSWYHKVFSEKAIKAGGMDALWRSIQDDGFNHALLHCIPCRDVVEQRRIQASAYMCRVGHMTVAPENTMERYNTNL